VRVHVPERGEKVRLVEMRWRMRAKSFEEKARTQKSQLEA